MGLRLVSYSHTCPELGHLVLVAGNLQKSDLEAIRHRARFASNRLPPFLSRTIDTLVNLDN